MEVMQKVSSFVKRLATGQKAANTANATLATAGMQQQQQQQQLTTATDLPGDVCCVCWESDDKVSLECCQGAICRSCLEAWVANRTAWPENASASETCPRCAAKLKGREVLSLIAAATTERQRANGALGESLTSDFAFASIRRRLPTLASIDVRSTLWKLLYTSRCPSCKVVFYKDGGCPNMTCKCGHRFRYVDPTIFYAHLSIHLAVLLFTYLVPLHNIYAPPDAPPRLLHHLAPCWLRFTFGLVVNTGLILSHLPLIEQPGFADKKTNAVFVLLMACASTWVSVGPWLASHCVWPGFAAQAGWIASQSWSACFAWALFKTPTVLATIPACSGVPSKRRIRRGLMAWFGAGIVVTVAACTAAWAIGHPSVAASASTLGTTGLGPISRRLAEEL